MVFIIYEWSVAREREQQFLKVWSETTQAIHRSVDGALGSFCLGAVNEPETIKTIAKWESLEQWESFIQTAKAESMKGLHDIGTLISSRAFNELGNHMVK